MAGEAGVSAVSMTSGSSVTLAGVRAARAAIAPHLPRTPLMKHPLLDAETGLDLWVKHENHLPTGAFKVRGGFNYLAHLGEAERRRGLITATRGNHGQSIALASRVHGVRCVIAVPHGNNPEKNAAMRAFGAELIEHGADFDAACEHAERLADEQGLLFVAAGSTPHLIHGVATCYLEIVEDLPDLDAVIVPIGGGSGVCGAITAVKALCPRAEVIGVQAANAPAFHDSWRAGRVAGAPSVRPTIADGLATRCPAGLPFEIISAGIDDIVLVSEEELRAAIRLYLRATHNVAEGAGAAPLAAAVQLAGRLRGRRVALPLTGGNIDQDTLRGVLVDGVPRLAGSRETISHAG